MPVIAQVVNYDDLYAEAVDSGLEPIIINDLPSVTEEDVERIRELTLNRLTSDTLSIVPTCGGTCRFTTGRNMLGKNCMKCGNRVTSPVGEVTKSRLWMRAPNGVDALVSPIAWGMFSQYFTKGSYDAMSYLTDSMYSPNTVRRLPVEIEKLDACGHLRDLNYFINNFDVILEDLIRIFPEKPNRPYRELREWVEDNRDKIFSKYQPLLSRNMFISDQTIVGQYMEESIQDQLDTIYHIVSIDRDFHDKSPRVISNRTARVLARQSKFYNKYTITNLQPKPGNYRRSIYGNRVNLAGRGVITSVTGEHSSDMVEVPWRIAVPMFQLHVMGKLMRAGELVNDAYGTILNNVCIYNEKVHAVLDAIFSEFKGGRGPTFLLHRNPTLLQGSMQRFFGKLKTDASDPTIGMSILTVVAPKRAE